VLSALVVLAGAGSAAAQKPPPAWDIQFGASFVGTSGNSDTSTVGGDFAYHNRAPAWQIESTANAVRTSDHGELTAEQYVATFRTKRKIEDGLGFSSGVRAERDQLSGIAVRTIVDGGLSWAMVERPRWSLDTLTSLAWNHEERLIGPNRDDPVGTLQLVNKIALGADGNTTQRITIYPDLQQASRYRGEAEVTAQASMNSWLALKFGYLLRYSNSPVPGFGKTDNTTTASVLFHWKSAKPAPPR
jgi:putative salt-induced outer membrane protein YdiY